MCGLAGFYGESANDADAARRSLARMVGIIDHRGPDAQGAWCDSEAGIALGHARLAIVELSPAGAQPMVSSGGRYVLTYNGEIYNHLALREDLAVGGFAGPWRGHSDTETLLAAIEEWGIEAALQQAIGMFAFALWDRRERRLILARDRLGEKPLYYGWQGNGTERTFLFASELKALAMHPAFDGSMDRDALTEFMRFGYVPAPQSIYRGISKLPPGTFAVLNARSADPVVHAYWSAHVAVEEGRRDPFTGSPAQAVDALEDLLSDAVRQQMMADVPLGAFLSGGVDSSTIVALMQAQSARPVRTFSIGFHEEGYNEADHAKAVAQHLGTDHTELYVQAEEARAVITRLPHMYDEPFADASQIPTFLVSRLAREHVTVSLSGDAGDELFCGYDRYGMTDRVWRRIRKLPPPARRLAARALTGLSPTTWNRLAKVGGHMVPALGRLPNPGRKIHKGAQVLASSSTAELYRGIVSQWPDPEALVIGGRETPAAAWRDRLWNPQLGDVENMMAADMITYLPDDILAKVDRAAMAVSLETRVPFLDHRVVEFAWRLPLDLKLRDGTSKWVLREVLFRHVPRALIERPKMGFGVPVGQWLRGPLREWAEALLDPRRLKEEGMLEPAPIVQAWQAHLSGAADLQYPLWNVLMFQAWSEEQKRARQTNHVAALSEPFDNRSGG